MASEIGAVIPGSTAFYDSPPASNDKQSNDAATDPLANKEVFLKLLVAQVKNQNPMDPVDGLQFVTQLTQFTELEQLIDIRQSLQDLVAASATDPSAGSGSDPKTQQG